MKKIILLLVLLCANIAFSQGFSLEGKIKNAFTGKIYLSYGGKTDSTQVTQGRFRFQGKVAHAIKANLWVSKSLKDTGFLVLENAPLTAEIVVENAKVVYLSSLTGSPSMERVKKFLLFKNKYRNAPNLQELIYKELNALIKSEPSNQFYGLLLLENMQQHALSYAQSKELFEMLVRSKSQDAQDISQMHLLLKTMQKTTVGATFPNVLLSTLSGERQPLETLRKKYTLLSFSSSECVSCIELDRKMQGVYQEFKNKSFAVVEVFLDDDKQVLSAHIKTEKIPWFCAIAQRKYNHPMIKELGITRLPCNFLLDEQGVIIATNIGPTLLTKKLSEWLK